MLPPNPRRLTPAAVTLAALLALPGVTQARDERVVLFIVDGVRQKEMLGLAQDDFGKKVSSASLWPFFRRKIRPRGTFYRNFEVSNKVGLSLPAYAEIFTGQPQPDVKTNSPRSGRWSTVPTLPEVVRQVGKLKQKDVVVLATWRPICSVLTSGQSSHAEHAVTARCGRQPGDLRRSPFSASRSDHDTLLDALATLKKQKPRFLVVVLGEVDEEGHLHHAAQRQKKPPYGIYYYHEAMRRSDHAMRRIWNHLQKDRFYRNRTTVLFTTDHGRCSDRDPKQWANHGRCTRYRHAKRPCAGCRKIFLHVSRPPRSTRLRMAPKNQRFSHINIAPTVLRLMGLEPPDWMKASVALKRTRRGAQRQKKRTGSRRR
jgi:hypothetical protein